MDDLDIDKIIKQEFLLEAKELLEDLEEGLLELERSPDDVEVVGKLFRVAHTIKGSGYAAKFDHLASLAHVFENLLGLIRSGIAECDSSVSDALLAGADKLKDYVGVLEGDPNARLDVDEVVAQLESETARFVSSSPDGVTESTDSGFGFFDDEPEASKPGSSASAESNKNTISKATRRRAHLSMFDSIDVVICDDEEPIRELLVEILEMEFGDSITIRQAESGVEALELISARSPDVVITDLKMPEMDGLEFLQALRSKSIDIPAIMVSGHASREHIVSLIKLGVYDFIDKPFDQDLISLGVKNALRTSKIQKGVVELSKLNFSAYLGMQRLLSSIGKVDPEKIKSMEVDLKEKLDTIALITNKLLK